MTALRLLPLLLATLPALALAVEELPIPEGLPADVKKLFDREVAPMPPAAWSVADRLAGKAEAAVPPKVTPGEEMDTVELPIGTAGPISCTVARERLDPGAWIWRFLDAARQNVTIAAVRPVDLAVVAGSPLLFVDALYAVETKEGKKVGLVKLAVYAHDTRMFLCQHDEPGYRKSFRRIVAGFAETMQGGEDEREGARYADVTAMRIGQMPVGFSETVLWDRKGGGTVTRTTTTMLLPRTAVELASLDSYEEEESDAKELVVSGAYAASENGELAKRVQLKRRADGKGFTVEGQKAGKPLKGTFTAKNGLASDLWFSRLFAAKAKPVAEVKHDTYSSEADPLRATATTFKRAKGSATQVEISEGTIAYLAELDEHGVPVKAELPLGPIKLAVERIWARGAP